jgi:hypothetical protein
MTEEGGGFVVAGCQNTRQFTFYRYKSIYLFIFLISLRIMPLQFASHSVIAKTVKNEARMKRFTPFCHCKHCAAISKCEASKTTISKQHHLFIDRYSLNNSNISQIQVHRLS